MIYFVVQGLIERADSIGSDLALQYRHLTSRGEQCRVFAGVFRNDLYPDIPIEPFERFPSTFLANPAPVIYHWCDGWREAEDTLFTQTAPVIVRWHNNTPPWFFAPYSLEPAARTVRGFRGVMRAANHENVSFLVNSDFSRHQLIALGVAPGRISVVYPVSQHLDAERPHLEDASPGRLRLLFVGRLVPHKGHRHVISAAARLRRTFNAESTVTFVGRMDPTMGRYVDELRASAMRYGVSVNIAGELPDDSLASAYAHSDVFICLSEHEGFGLPVVEAMRAGLPVVAYRGSAVAEVVGDHPMCVDTLDPDAVAARLLDISTVQKRNRVIAWQDANVLPRFSLSVAMGQLDKALAERLGGSRGISALSVAPESRDLVTVADVSAYEAMLSRAAIDPESTDLRDEVMRMRFVSSRPIVGRLVSIAKKVSLVANDGVVSAIAKSERRIESRIEHLENLLSPDVTADHAASADAGSIVYNAQYFEGGRARSNYESYSRDAKTPGRIIARDLYDAFRPASSLDVGCALGFMVKELRQLGSNAFGIDISHWAVQQAADPSISQFDVSKNHISGSYDLVTCYDVLEHMPPERLAFAIENLWMATERFLVVIAAYYEEGTTHDPNEHTHLIFHPKEWWETMFEHSGVQLDRGLAAELDRSVHAQTYNYAGRFIVGRKV